MTLLQIMPGDNLANLLRLKESGAKFDLIELDGPYMAGLEDWDNMTEAEYIAHYAERLSLVRDVLQPWGVVFVFGYPEGCAEIKSWAHRTETLYLRRWLHWYKQRTAHKGRKVEIVLVLQHWDGFGLFEQFRNWLREKRNGMGLTINQALPFVGLPVYPNGGGGGYLWFEAKSSDIPSRPVYGRLKTFFNIPDRFDMMLDFKAFTGLTDLDYFDKSYPEETAELNDNGLRSKPVGLYLDLFRPTVPPTENKQALILYGGSGNAGIAAAALGYGVTICEQGPERCEAIERRWDRDVAKWTQRATAVQMNLPLETCTQGVLI